MRELYDLRWRGPWKFRPDKGGPVPPFDWEWLPFALTAGAEQGQWVGYSDGGPTRPQPAFGSINRQPTPRTELLALYDDTNSGVFLAVFAGDFTGQLAGVQISFGGFVMDSFEVELIDGNTWVRFSGIPGDLTPGAVYEVEFGFDLKAAPIITVPPSINPEAGAVGTRFVFAVGSAEGRPQPVAAYSLLFNGVPVELDPEGGYTPSVPGALSWSVEWSNGIAPPATGQADAQALASEDMLAAILGPGATQLQTLWADPKYWFSDVAGTVPVAAPGVPIRCWKTLEGANFVQPTNADFAPVSRRWPKTGRRNRSPGQTEIPTNGSLWNATGGALIDGAYNEVVTNTQHNVFGVGAASSSLAGLPVGTPVVLSMWVRGKGATTAVQIAMGSSYFGNGKFANFSLLTGEVVATGCTASAVPEDDGWRISVEGTTTVAGASGAPFALATINNNMASGRAPSFVGNTTNGFDIRRVQVEVGPASTQYQDVVSQNDITESGVPSVWWAAFDGVDDWLQSAAPVDLTASGQLSLFTGAKKLSDAAQGTLVELSINAPSSSYTGSFIVRAPQTAGGDNFMFYNRGATGSQNAQATGLPAPQPTVLTGLSDLSDVAHLRANGTLRTTTAAVFGGGNYRSDILYVGRRAGTSVPFNGMLQSLSVRGGDLPDAGIVTQAETIINSVIGSY